MARVLLIKPPIRACMIEIGRHMPIGLAYLAAVLRDAGHEVSIFDSLAFTEDNHVVPEERYTDADRRKLAAHPRWQHLIHWGAREELVVDAIEGFEPDVVGISCMFTPYYEPAYELARLAKRLRPDAKVVLGGQHPTVAAAHALGEPAIDVLVLGEAERTILSLLDAFADGALLTSLQGVAFRCAAGLCDCADPSGTHVLPNRDWIEDLDALPFPASDELDFSRYDDTATLITSRGCPFSCSFCTVHATVGKAFRSRSPESVADEIEHYVEAHGVTRFNIEDDNFTFDIDRVVELCDTIRARNLGIELNLPNGMTVVKLSEPLVDAMAAAGFRSLFLGLETTDLLRLRKIRKGFTSLDKVQVGAAWFEQRGVDVGASLIVGLPGQSRLEIARDSLNMINCGVRFWTNPFYPIPGSPDFVRCTELGLISGSTELALFDQFNFAIGSDELAPEELYWAWVTTQAMAQWPAYVAEGAERRRDGEAIDLTTAAERLVEASAGLLRPDRALEVPALPVAVEGDRIVVHRDGCFCSLHQLAERATGGGPVDTCRLTGDVLAAAVALHSASPAGATQVVSAARDVGAACAFRLDEAPVPTAEAIQLEVIGELDRMYAEELAVA